MIREKTSPTTQRVGLIYMSQTYYLQYNTPDPIQNSSCKLPDKFLHPGIRSHKQLLRRALLPDDAILHKDNTVGQLSGKLHFMSDNNHRHMILRQLTDYL